MTEEQEVPAWSRRFRWAKCAEPYATAIEGVMLVWADAQLSNAAAIVELNKLDGQLRQKIEAIGDSAIEVDGPESKRLIAEIAEFMMVSDYIETSVDAVLLSEKREDVTAKQRQQSLADSIQRSKKKGTTR